MTTQDVFFSVIIPTRNRVALFKEALGSVLEQSLAQKEVIVVNDGSTEPLLSEYKQLQSEFPDVQFHFLVHRPNGHGQSYSMNFGASHAKGQYLCFLDDDDYWNDLHHLERAYKSIINSSVPVDVFYTNQEAYFPDGTQKKPNPWIADVANMLGGPKKDDQGSFHVDTELLLRSKGFAHLNCSIFRRDFYNAIKGMDENIRYECDRDIYIRSLDQANHILYNPAVVSYHRIPDPKNTSNMSTAITDFQKRLYQLGVYEKGILMSKQKLVRRFCQKGKGYQLKYICEALRNNGENALAAQYAWQALTVKPSFKWLLFSCYLGLKAIFNR